jgi:hypothetical protein
MRKYNLAKYEQETIINYNEESKTASIYTCNKALIKKLLQYCKRFSDMYQLKKKDTDSVTVECLKKFISIRKPILISNERREKMKLNFKKTE